MKNYKKLGLWIAIGIVLGLSLFNLLDITIKRLIINHQDYQECKLYEEWYLNEDVCPKSNANAVCKYFGEKSFTATCIELGVKDKLSDCGSGGAYYVLPNQTGSEDG